MQFHIDSVPIAALKFLTQLHILMLVLPQHFHWFSEGTPRPLLQPVFITAGMGTCRHCHPLSGRLLCEAICSCHMAECSAASHLANGAALKSWPALLASSITGCPCLRCKDPSLFGGGSAIITINTLERCRLHACS